MRGKHVFAVEGDLKRGNSSASFRSGSRVGPMIYGVARATTQPLKILCNAGSSVLMVVGTILHLKKMNQVSDWVLPEAGGKLNCLLRPQFRHHLSTETLFLL
ncbi:MAG: hypothetical protein CMM07_29545 [Rhodopirellula sp.]|nr:hypothetical protein [Rhodopirellula sp.]